MALIPSGRCALQQPDWLLHGKLAEREALLARSKADIPNTTLQAAFDWAKMNLADMRRVITDAQIWDTQDGTLQGKIYPPLLETYALLSGFGSGYPDYPGTSVPISPHGVPAGCWPVQNRPGPTAASSRSFAYG